LRCGEKRLVGRFKTTKLGFEMAKKIKKGNVAGILRLNTGVFFLVKYVSFFNHG